MPFLLVGALFFSVHLLEASGNPRAFVENICRQSANLFLLEAAQDHAYEKFYKNLSNGAKIDVLQKETGNSALICATTWKLDPRATTTDVVIERLKDQHQIVRLLIELNANITHKNNSGQTALDIALSNKYFINDRLVRILFDALPVVEKDNYCQQLANEDYKKSVGKSLLKPFLKIVFGESPIIEQEQAPKDQTLSLLCQIINFLAL
jgi:hypothetical protein